MILDKTFTVDAGKFMYIVAWKVDDIYYYMLDWKVWE